MSDKKVGTIGGAPPILVTPERQRELALAQLRRIVRLVTALDDSPKSLLHNLKEGLPAMQAVINGLEP